LSGSDLIRWRTARAPEQATGARTSLLAVETNLDSAVDLDERVVPGRRWPGIDDSGGGDGVGAAGFVDVAAEHEVWLFSLDEGPDDGAADVLAARESVAGGPHRRRVWAKDLVPAVLDVVEASFDSPLDLVVVELVARVPQLIRVLGYGWG
jgi:hypothetical protein